jgi:hypothetical protein
MLYVHSWRCRSELGEPFPSDKSLRGLTFLTLGSNRSRIFSHTASVDC